MKKSFIISLSLQTPDGALPYAKFSLGADQQTATSIFAMLKGKAEVSKPCGITVQLLEEIGELPVPIGVMVCNVDELKENVALISKELFRIAHLENTGFPLPQP